MTTPAKVRIVGIVAACLILTISGVWNSHSNPAKVHADQVKDARLKELLTAKVATLKEMAAVTATMYRENRGSYDEAHAATQALHKAELELRETSQERIEILEKMLTAAKEQETYRAGAHKEARGTFADVLKARAERLDVEIALYRAKSK